MSVERYLAASKVFDSAKAKAEAIAKSVRLIGHAMENWRTVAIDGTDISFTNPAGNRSVNISANSWPTAIQMAEAFAEYHRAFDRVRLAWESILSGDRAGLAAPLQ